MQIHDLLVSVVGLLTKIPQGFEGHVFGGGLVMGDDDDGGTGLRQIERHPDGMHVDRMMDG